jgi:hypothetical protein
MARLATLWAPRLAGRDARDYDEFVLSAASGHYAQTRAWADVALRARPCRVRFFLARDGGDVVGAALVLRASVGPVVLPFAEVERGPVCARVEDVPRVARALGRCAALFGVAHLAIMPYWGGDHATQVEASLRAEGFSPANRADGAHAATLRLPLVAGAIERTLGGGDREQLRRLVRKAVAAGATVERGGPSALAEHRRFTARRAVAAGAHDKSRTWYEALAAWLDDARGAIFVCRFAGKAVGTAIVLRHGGLAVYAYGATDPAPRAFSKSVLPLVEAIRWASDAGCDRFDMGGVPAAGDRDAKRASIARFKRHFAKETLPLVRRHARWSWNARTGA